MAIVGTAEVIVRTTSAGLEKDIATAVNKASVAASKSAQITPKVNTKEAEAASGRLGQTLTALRGKLKSVADEGGPVSSRLAKIAESATSIGPAGVLAGLGLAALVAVVGTGIEKFFTLADQVHKFQLVTNASAEDASRFVVALRVLGVEPDRIAGGLFRLNRQLQAGKSGLLDYGVQITTTRSGGIDLVETFLNIADAVHSSSNETRQQEIAFAAFGRQGIALLPILARGRDGLKELFTVADKSGELLHQSDVDTAIEAQIEIRKLKEQINGLQVEAGKGGIPLLKSGLHALTNVVNGVHDAFYYGAKGAKILADGAVALGSAQNGTSAALAHTGNAARDMGADLAYAAQKAAYLGGLQTDLQGSVLSYVNAQHASRDATQAVDDANQGVADAQDRYNKLLATGGRDIGQIRSAQDGLRSSSKALQSARESLATAEQKLADIEKGSSPRELESADLHAREAVNALAHANQNLVDIRKQHKSSALDISDAENQVEEAQLASADAQDALTKAQQAGTDQDPEVVAAKKQVADAHDAVAEAAGREADAAKALRDAQAPDPDFYANLASAQRDVDAAKRGVTKATEGQVTSVFALATAEDAYNAAIGRDAGAIGLLYETIKRLADTTGIDVSDILSQDIFARLTLPSGTPQAAPATPTFFGAPVAGFPTTKGSVSPRARLAGGGNADAGYWYQINENGTEYFSPKSSGTVVPIGHGGGQSGVVINQHISGGDDPQTTAQLTGVYTGRAIRTVPR